MMLTPSVSESLSNLLSGCTIAAVPRLRPFRSTLGRDASCTATPRPHLHSRSLGGGAMLSLTRFHRQMVVTAEKAKRTHSAMLRPQTALIS